MERRSRGRQMDATIGYVGQVRETSWSAFRTERAGRGRPRHPRRLPSGRLLVALSSVVVLVAAGGLGWVITRDDPSRRCRRPARRASPAPRAHTAGARGRRAGDAGAGGVRAVRRRRPILRDAANLNEVDLPGSAASSRSAKRTRDPTAELTLVLPADSFAERFASAQDVAERHGGFVQTSTGASARARSSCACPRTSSPPRCVTSGPRRRRGPDASGQDVTGLRDLQARLRIAKSRRDVLLGLMAEATPSSRRSACRTRSTARSCGSRSCRARSGSSTTARRSRRSASSCTRRASSRSRGREPSFATAWTARSPASSAWWGRRRRTRVPAPILAIGAVVWFTVRWVRRRRAA